MTEAEIYAALTEIFVEAFDDEGLTLRPEMTAKDVEGWDSYKMVNILIAAEERFGIKMRTREIDKLASVGDFVVLIKEKLAAG